jgi:hypothetical protein
MVSRPSGIAGSYAEHFEGLDTNGERMDLGLDGNSLRRHAELMTAVLYYVDIH